MVNDTIGRFKSRFRWRPGLLAAILCVWLAAFGLRMVNLGVSWDIHIDEITYLQISKSVVDSFRVSLYGEPFYLHPPAYFVTEAAFVELFHPSGFVIQQIYSVRYLNLAFASGSAVILFLLARSVANRNAGFIAATLFAIDPFVIRMNSRAMLDTSAIFWVLLGYLILISVVKDTQAKPSLKRLALAGLAFGVGLLTKDMMAFLTLVPLGISFLFDWSLPRLSTAIVGAVSILTYLSFPLLIALSGDWQRFQQEKFTGIARLVGAERISYQPTIGFRPGAASIVNAISANANQFGTTYVLALLGIIAIIVLFTERKSSIRLLTTWAICAYTLLLSSIVLGTLEEQFLYFLVIPAILVIAVGWTHITVWKRLEKRFLRVAQPTAIMIGVLLFIWSMIVWTQVHFTPDNGFERLRVYLEQNVPSGSHIGVSVDTTEFLLDGYDCGLWGSSIDLLRAHQAQYLIVSSQQVKAGYGIARQNVYDWATKNGEAAFAFEGRTYGTLSLYRLPESY